MSMSLTERAEFVQLKAQVARLEELVLSMEATLTDLPSELNEKVNSRLAAEAKRVGYKTAKTDRAAKD